MHWVGCDFIPNTSQIVSVFITTMIINICKNIYNGKNTPNFAAVSLVIEPIFCVCCWKIIHLGNDGTEINILLQFGLYI